MTYREKAWKYFKTRNKYNNQKTEYNGNKYDSKYESKVAQELDIRIAAKDIKSYERQKKISLDVNGYHICNYYVDFVVTHNDGRIEYLEAKSTATMTPVFRVKWKLFEALYADKVKNGEILLTILIL